MAYTPIPDSGSGSTTGGLAVSYSFLAGKMGGSEANFSAVLEDFVVNQIASTSPGTTDATPVGWRKQIGAGANAIDVTGFKGGVCRLLTTTTAGSNVQLDTRMNLFQKPDIDTWGMIARVRFPNATDANSRIGIGITDATAARSVTIGIFPQLSSGQIVLQYGLQRGSNAANIAAQNTNWNIVFMYGLGDGNYHYGINGVEIGVVPALSPIVADARGWIDVYDNGVGGTADAIDVDYVAYRVPRL